MDALTVTVTRIAAEGRAAATRTVPVEAPIAVSFNGIGYAVMMATPVDLEDFATGFALSERIVAAAGEIESIETQETPEGWLLDVRLAGDRVAPMIERVRRRVSESSCGLCGLENLEQVNRPLPKVTAAIDISDAAIFSALAGLSARQPLNARTGGVHAAAFCVPDGTIIDVREDVGRHTAFDKLIGALAREGRPVASGFFLLTSRCSYELVEKAVIAGAPLLVTVSTATSLAVARAEAAGLRLVMLARHDAMLEVGG
jgi:FdhD protein